MIQKYLAFPSLQQCRHYLQRSFILIAPLVFGTMVVNAATYTVTTNSDAGAGSLRQAISDANTSAGADVINFNITGAGLHTITLSSLLPTITGPTSINGYSQPGAAQGAIGSRTILIEVNGNSITGRDGLFRFTSTAGGSSISGLSVYNTGSSTDAVAIEPGNANIHIWGNYIGLLANGSSPAAAADFNGDDGIFLGDNSVTSGSFTNIIIGTNGDGTNDANEGNVIANSADGTNGGDGIQLGTDVASYTWTSIRIAGNYIGLAANGTTAAPNGLSAIGATETNGFDGINIKSAANVLIGTDGNGTSDTLERNIISGNTGNGIEISKTSSFINIAGNYIGTDKNGTTGLPNGIKSTSAAPYCGILVIGGSASNIVIGFDDAVHSAGTASATRNIISANYCHGIQFFNITGASNKISGNYIGVDATGNTALGNGRYNISHPSSVVFSNGVDINATKNLLVGTNGNGDDDVYERNVISGNIDARGVHIRNNASAASFNIIAGNYIGVGANGSTAVGNDFSGILIDLSGSNRIGSNDDGANDAVEVNIIANNARTSNAASPSTDGLRITGNATQNRISRNVFYSNKENPIDLSNNGVSVNDGATTASNPNILTDYPVFTAGKLVGTTMTVSGYIGSCSGTSEAVPGTVTGGTTTVQVYKLEDDGDQNGAISGIPATGCTRSVTHGEGRQYLGSITVTGGTFTNATFTLAPGASFTRGDQITGITIDANGNTSEFGVSVVMIISGKILNDANSSGSTAGAAIKDGSESGTNAGAPLWVYLISGGTIVDSAKVDIKGDYQLTGLPGTVYTIELSRSQYAIGTAGVTAATIDNSMVSGWALTGEGVSNTSDGTPDGTINLTTPPSGNSINNNFGVQQPIPCATNELTADTRFIFTTGSNATVNASSLSFNGWTGSGTGVVDISASNTYIYDNLNTQTFTHAFSGVNPLGTGAVIAISLGVRNGIAGVPSITNYGKATVLSIIYGGVVYATVTTDGTIATDGHMATINYSGGATGSYPNGYTFDYGVSPQLFSIMNIADWQIFLPSSVPNNSSLAIEFNPGGSSSGDASDDFTIGAVSIKGCPISITGSIFNDIDGLNDSPAGIVDNNGGAQPAATLPSGLTANLFNAATGAFVGTANVIGGIYTFPNVAQNTDYIVILSNVPATASSTAATFTSALPAGWANTGDVNPTDPVATALTPGVSSVIEVLTSNTSNVNFGIERGPTATAKAFAVTASDFSPTPAPGYPAVPGYVSIKSGSPALTGYDGTGGKLSGTDPDDCALANACNTGSTFTIGAINSNTLLYYDFGSGPVALTSGSVITGYDPAKLVIYGQVGSGTTGSPIGFSYSITDAAGVVSQMATYAITSSIALPVNLLDFSVVKSGNTKALLNWNTAVESNLTNIAIEHSANGAVWQKIGSQQPKGNNSQYSFLHNNPVNGLNLYRLLFTEMDGTMAYSPVKTQNFNNLNDYSIGLYPNPAIQTVQLSYTGTSLKGADLQIINSTGQIMLNQNITDNTNSISINIRAIPNGFYVVRMIHNGVVYSRNLIIE